MHVTSKGQVTIPVEIRRKLGIDENSEVDFVEEDGKVVLVVHDTSEAEFNSWLKRIAGTWQSDLTSDDVMRLTRGED
jgi:AbrB family looped-hinge helix DNA binding protein